jgi:hypothetical protein
MRGFSRLAVVLLAVLLAVVPAACGGDDGEDAEPRPEDMERPMARPGVFVGAVAFSIDRIALALDDPDSGGRQQVRAYVTDGEPGGDSEWFEGTATGGRIELTSKSGKARLSGAVGQRDLHGTITLADGVNRHFHTIPATHGAGIYDVTVTADGRYTGTSTTGAKLEAEQAGNFVEGALMTPEGDRFPYRVVDASRVFGYETPGSRPDRYTLIVSRYGLNQVGRGGGDAVKAGSPGANLIALDLGASRVPTPGSFYGKVARSTDQFLLVVDQPPGQANRRARVYLSDGEPEPEGDIEWFTGPVVGTRIDLTSAGGRARLSGEITADSVRGTVTLEGGRHRPFFAVPAGDGAGIYEVTVGADGIYKGTSEDGSTLDIRQNGSSVAGTISTRQGTKIDLLAYDLTRVFDYNVKGSPPDKYLAFASPGGRYVIGRSGDVRGGTAGNNIIGLDKAC